MGFELDPLDDIFAEDSVKNATTCAGGKFQPRAKQRPLRKHSTTTSVSSSQPITTTNEVEHDEPSEQVSHQDNQKEASVPLSFQNIVETDRPDSMAGVVSDSAVIPDGKQPNLNKSEEFCRGFELDPLDDIFAEGTVKNATTRAGGKFQPKLKPRPLRKRSTMTSVSSSEPITTTNEVKRDNPSEHVTDQDNQKVASVPLSSQNIVEIDRPDTPPDSAVIPDGKQPNLDKSENRDISLGLDAQDDLLSRPTANMGEQETTAEGSSPSETLTENAVDPITVQSSVGAFSCPQQTAVKDPLTGGEPIISTSYHGDHMDKRVVETEEMDTMDTLLLSELAIRSGRHSGKFQPKLKVRMQNKINETSTTNADRLHTTSSPKESQSVPCEIDVGNKSSNPAVTQDDDLVGLSAVGFTHATPTESMPEPVVNEDPIEPVQKSKSEGNARARKKKTIPSAEQQYASTSGQENGARRSSRPRKKKGKGFHLVDESDDHGDSEFQAERPSSFVAGEDNIADNEVQVENENEPQKKKVKRKSTKSSGDKEKGAQKRNKAKETSEDQEAKSKRKKAKETSDKEAKSKPKKFSHSTVRRRKVDKVLLETPEDEIDFQKVPLRDLILLAEHKEQLQKKEAKAGVSSANQNRNQSNGNPSENYNEDDPFAFEQDEEYDREQGSPRVEESDRYLNYQSFMDKTPRAKWSKQDTELFYQAIRQFGTDLSMIQQLFPGRTRNQVKLKFKNEERKHPMRLREALSTRPTDHSHFEKVIEYLQQIAAEENNNSNKDEPIDLSGNEDAQEGTRDANEEEQKTERDGEDEEVVQEEEQSPVKSYDSEDDMYLWSQYKSDV